MSLRVRSPRATRVAIGLASVLFVLALVVRGAKPAAAVRPEDVVESGPRIAEPMQLLSRGAGLRVGELDKWVSAKASGEFRAVRQSVFALQGCPATMDWLDGSEGQRFERYVSTLRGGEREDAFAALVLLFQVARATEWKPGVLGKSAHAERLGGLMEDWLRSWGVRGARDSLLAEPVMAAALVYGRVMRMAWRAPMVGYNEAPMERAKVFLGELVGESGRRTEFGNALQARHARAAQRLVSERDVLQGFEEECAALYPKLVGDCGDG